MENFDSSFPVKYYFSYFKLFNVYTSILLFRLNMWIGLLITLIIGGFIFYALATTYEHIEHSKNTAVEVLNNDTKLESIALEKKDPVLIKENMDIKNIINIINNFKNKFNKSKISEQKLIAINIEDKKIDNTKDVVGLYLFNNIGNSILYTYGMLVFVSLPKVPTGWAIRILTGWWWMYCLLVVVAYKASMTAILANPDTRLYNNF